MTTKDLELCYRKNNIIEDTIINCIKRKNINEFNSFKYQIPVIKLWLEHTNEFICNCCSLKKLLIELCELYNSFYKENNSEQYRQLSQLIRNTLDYLIRYNEFEFYIKLENPQKTFDDLKHFCLITPELRTKIVTSSDFIKNENK